MRGTGIRCGIGALVLATWLGGAAPVWAQASSGMAPTPRNNVSAAGLAANRPGLWIQNALTGVMSDDFAPRVENARLKTCQRFTARWRVLVRVTPESTQGVRGLRHQLGGGAALPGTKVHLLQSIIEAKR